MKQITHAWFRGQASELRNACWNHVHLEDLMADLLPRPAGRATAA